MPDYAFIRAGSCTVCGCSGDHSAPSSGNFNIRFINAYDPAPEGIDIYVLAPGATDFFNSKPNVSTALSIIFLTSTRLPIDDFLARLDRLKDYEEPAA